MVGDDIAEVRTGHDGQNRHFRLPAGREGQKRGYRIAQPEGRHQSGKPGRQHRQHQHIGHARRNNAGQLAPCDAQKMHPDAAADEKLRDKDRAIEAFTAYLSREDLRYLLRLPLEDLVC